jgi:RNA-directed DNA polymerase
MAPYTKITPARRKPTKAVGRGAASLPWWSDKTRCSWTLDQFRFLDVIDADNLIAVYQRLAASAGQAPGPDGLTYADLGRREVAMNMRCLSKSLSCGHYRPSQAKLLQIPKASGKGTRTLSIRVLLDRVVQKALDLALTPAWDQHFLPGSCGFRPKLSPWHCLAKLAAAFDQDPNLVILADDIRDAFNHVPVSPVLDLHKRYLHDSNLLNLISVVLRGDNLTTNCRGIDQGGAYSPTCLNVLLHHVLDQPLEKRDTLPLWLRYADNLVLVGPSAQAVQQARSESVRLLAGVQMTLKGEGADPVHLAGGDSIELLGFRISLKNRELRLDLAASAWEHLRKHWDLAHQAANPPQAATSCLQGWLDAYGPGLGGQRQQSMHYLQQLAGEFGFQELPARQKLDHWAKQSRSRWLRTLHEVKAKTAHTEPSSNRSWGSAS